MRTELAGRLPLATAGHARLWAVAALAILAVVSVAVLALLLVPKLSTPEESLPPSPPHELAGGAPPSQPPPATASPQATPASPETDDTSIGGLQLSSPVAGVAPLPGQGAGYHSPESPFKPLTPRDDVLDWKDLTQVKQVFVRRTVEVHFSEKIEALNGQTVRIQGFMMPLGAGEEQRDFLVSSVPLTCAFCTPGGPESIVDVNAVEDVPYSMDAVVVEGRLDVLRNDSKGFFYRLHDARSVK